MARKKKCPTVHEYQIFYYPSKQNGKKKKRIVGYIKSTNPKKALASFLSGEGKCLYPSVLTNESIRNTLRAEQKRINFKIFTIVKGQNAEDVEIVIGYIYAYSEKSALSGFKKGHGQHKILGTLEIEALCDNLHAKPAK